jgi:hypothetical protein
MSRRGGSIEEALADLTKEAGAASVRGSWKRALVLGVVLFLGIGVALPYGLELWSQAHMESAQQTKAGQIFGPALHQVFLMRAVLPLRIGGTIAGIVCLAIALWKLLVEIYRTR